MSHALAIRLPKEINERLSKLAKVTGRTKTYYARQAIISHLEDLEDTYLALQRLEKPGKFYSTAEVVEELGLKEDKEE